MRYIEREGRTVEEALLKALGDAGIGRADARYEVLDEGLYGERPARVRLYLDAEEFDKIEEVVQEFLSKIGAKADVETIIPRNNNTFYVNVSTRGWDAALIGKEGKTLEALDYLLNLILKKRLPGVKVQLDIAGYRERRKRFIVNKALAIARRVKETGKEMRMDPLTPEEQRLVREALRRDSAVRVRIIQHGSENILVIAPAQRRRKRKSSARKDEE